MPFDFVAEVSLPYSLLGQFERIILDSIGTFSGKNGLLESGFIFSAWVKSTAKLRIFAFVVLTDN